MSGTVVVEISHPVVEGNDLLNAVEVIEVSLPAARPAFRVGSLEDELLK